MSDLLEGVAFFAQSSIRIRRGGVEVHVDPWRVEEESVADFVLLTHPHFDNFSEEDIAKVTGPETVIIAPSSMKKQLDEGDHFLRPGDLIQLEELDVLAVPAFNVAKKFHPRAQGWLGYVFTLDGVTYYHAGDTDFLESMYDLQCDVAFLPCEGHYTMGPEEAARAGVACGARVVVPVHWGGSAGSREAAERLVQLFPGVAAILEPGIGR